MAGDSSDIAIAFPVGQLQWLEIRVISYDFLCFASVSVGVLGKKSAGAEGSECVFGEELIN